MTRVLVGKDADAEKNEGDTALYMPFLVVTSER